MPDNPLYPDTSNGDLTAYPLPVEPPLYSTDTGKQRIVIAPSGDSAKGEVKAQKPKVPEGVKLTPVEGDPFAGTMQGADVPTAINRLFGTGGEERYQLWPEKMIRSGLSLPGDVMAGRQSLPGTEGDTPGLSNLPGSVPYGSPEGQQGLARVQDMAGLAGVGGVPMAQRGALGAAGGAMVQPVEGVIRGSFQGKNLPSVDTLVRNKDKFIYHSGTADNLENLKYGIDPTNEGQWIKELAEHVGVDNPQELLDNATPLAWFSDNPKWVSTMVGRKIGKHPQEVTDEDIINHGHLALITKKGDHAENVWHIGEEGFDGEYTDVTNLKGEKKKAQQTDLYQSDWTGNKEPFGIEKNEYVSAQPVEAMFHLTGKPLLDFLKKTETLKSDTSHGAAIQAMAHTRPAPELLNRVLPALKDLKTGEVSTVRRGNTHVDAIHDKWQKEGGDPNADNGTVIENMLDRHAPGYYDPKTKTFHDRNEPEWQNIDSSELMTPRQKLAKFGTLYSDTSHGAAIQALAHSNPFYSAVEHAVNNIQQPKMNAEQWLGTIANKPGVKPEELEWTGLKDWLAEQKGPVSKEAVQQYIAENKTQLGEVNKQDSEYFTPVYKDSLVNRLKTFSNTLNEFKNINDVAIAKKYNMNFRESVKGKSDQEIFDAIQEAKSLPNFDQLTNYRHDTREEAEAAIKNANAENHLDVLPVKSYKETKYSQYQLPRGENYRELLMTLPQKTDEQFKAAWKARTGVDIDNATPEQINNMRRVSAASEVAGDYKSSHWDEPNVLAHIRMNDRIVDGKKSLHVEEIQSDWHQQGREEGYKGDLENLIKQRDNLKADFVNAKNKEDAIRRTDELNAIHDKIYQLERGSPVPQAPFKKTWSDLAIKRIIREAAEKGYDRISWTPGGANKTNPKVLGQTGEAAEASDRGLREFYDEIIPKKFEKISKQQVKEGETVVRPKGETYIEGKSNLTKAADDIKESVHYIDVPQSLKDTATQKGFPLYAAGIPLTPVDHHPFVNNQNEVPYGAGASNTPSGYPVNIDKSIPQYDDRLKDKTGKPADLWKYLSIHEIAEHNAMEHNKTPYLKAHHDIATPAERAAVEADGVNWNEYEKIMDGFLKGTEHEKVKDIAPNLYTKPYPHHKADLLKRNENGG